MEISNKNNAVTFTVKQTLALLKQLQLMPLLQDMRLVGGTALALQLGHQNSVDLDLFSDVYASHIDFMNAFSDEGLVFRSLQIPVIWDEIK